MRLHDTFSRPVCTALLCLATSAALAAEPGAENVGADPGVSAEPGHNYCLGGIEDRKLIVEEDRISNPFRQTSRLGCEVDGGRPQIMPDLPAPAAAQRALA